MNSFALLITSSLILYLRYCFSLDSFTINMAGNRSDANQFGFSFMRYFLTFNAVCLFSITLSETICSTEMSYS